MIALAEVLKEAGRHLDRAGFRWALVGGLAVAIHAEPRLTRDVDLAVAVADDQQAESLIYELQQRGYQVIASIEQDARQRLATIRLVPPGQESDAIVVDLLFASSGIEPEIVEGARQTEIFPGVTAPVASRGHLLALKILARDDRGRPHDYDDLLRLLEEASSADLEQARQALRRISDRGYDRGRELLRSFEDLLEATG